MQGLATELGVTRMTLHRHTGGRDRLIGEALWQLSAQAWARSEEEVDGDRRPDDGELRSARVIRAFNGRLVESRAVRTLLDTEPELSLRLITDPDGPIQPRTIARTLRLIESDERAGRLRPVIAREDLAYALVKLAEAFLFGDLAAGRPVALQTANQVQTALLEAGRTRPGGT
ncbi:QsdR family transcriptional regulator [Petropleomorpha daqingensis]|nr:QsdR family transcriptional regulator [Petropleomorpha daqingensis]